MKILFLVLFILSNNLNDNCSTFYLIRHAEKIRVDSSDRDPDLNEKGKERALRWSEYFSNIKLSKIYSTNYKRTINTVQPLASEKKLEIKFYVQSEIEYEEFMSNNKGESVLIAGHSNTTPFFANALIGEDVYSQIDDFNNSNLYIVNICNNELNHRLIKVE